MTITTRNGIAPHESGTATATTLVGSTGVQPVSVLILDQRRRVREDLAAAVHRLPGQVEVTGISEPGELLVRLRRGLPDLPDLVLVGTQRADNSCLQAVAAALQEFPQLRAVAVGSADDATTIADAMAAGASGFLRWRADGAELSMSLLSAVRPSLNGARPESARSLSERERQVLEAISDGKSNIEIGRALFLSENTIKTHTRRLFAKLGAKDRAEAVTIGFRSGLLR